MASLSAKVRGMYLAGQTINATDLAKKLKCSASSITMVKKNMEREGYIFQATNRKVGPKVFVDHKLAAVPEGLETKVPPRRNAAAQPSTNGDSPPLPVLGQTLTVTLLAVDEHGTVSIGLREGKKSWLCELRGQTNS